jgi:hypothetical protein
MERLEELGRSARRIGSNRAGAVQPRCRIAALEALYERRWQISLLDVWQTPMDGTVVAGQPPSTPAETPALDMKWLDRQTRRRCSLTYYRHERAAR